MTAIATVAPIAGLDLAPTRSRLAAWIARIGAILRQLGPYAAIEILLPGGTLMALLLWLYRRSANDARGTEKKTAEPVRTPPFLARASFHTDQG